MQSTTSTNNSFNLSSNQIQPDELKNRINTMKPSKENHHRIIISMIKYLVIATFLSNLNFVQCELQHNWTQTDQATSYLKKIIHQSNQTDHQDKTEHNIASAATISTLNFGSQITEPSANLSATTISSMPLSSLSSYISDILLHVQGLDLDNRPHTADPSSDHNDDVVQCDDCGDSSSQLSAPTDSEEDPLELVAATASTTILAPEQSQNSQQQATQYAITASSIVNSSHSSKIDHNDEDSDDQRTAIDSNNVSAVIAHSVSRPDNRIIPESPTKQQSIACEQAITQCAFRKACAPALKAYNDDCHDLINNQTNTCSSRCLKAMIALRSSEEGADLATCDCQDNDYCTKSKQRSSICEPQVKIALDPKTDVSCSTARWICMADQLCATALDYYYRNCQSLLTQRYCSGRCNNSLTILYRQPKASKLITCKCDGSEEFPCLKLKAYTERHCLNKPFMITDSADEQEAGMNEEKTSNLTNDSENFVLGASVSSSGYDSDDGVRSSAESEFGPKNDFKEESGFNGIQLVEDNWIPLISSRYFMNLHQQRQTAQQVKEGAEEEEQQQQQQRQDRQNQHQTRKSLRNIRQHRTESSNNSSSSREGKRGRYLRVLMFAASTSSATPANRSNANGQVTIWAFVVSMLMLMFIKCPCINF